MKIRSAADFWSGLMFMGFGTLALVVAGDYPVGTAMRMGPGYFPILIGGFLILIGAAIVAIALRIDGAGIGAWPWRAMALMSIAFMLFAWGMEHIGFIPSLAVLIVVSALSTPYFRWREILIEALVMIAGSWAVFVYGLELPFRLWGSY